MFALIDRNLKFLYYTTIYKIYMKYKIINYERIYNFKQNKIKY